jgi:GDP-L-fucose synthase
MVSVEIWGTGDPKREFLYVDDMADACVYLMENYDEKQFVNIGCGEDISIKDLAYLVKEIVGFKGELTPPNRMEHQGSCWMLDGCLKRGGGRRLNWKRGLEILFIPCDF